MWIASSNVLSYSYNLFHHVESHLQMLSKFHVKLTFEAVIRDVLDSNSAKVDSFVSHILVILRDSLEN